MDAPTLIQPLQTAIPQPGSCQTLIAVIELIAADGSEVRRMHDSVSFIARLDVDMTLKTSGVASVMLAQTGTKIASHARTPKSLSRDPAVL